MDGAQARLDSRSVGPSAYIADSEAHSRICIAEALLAHGFACRDFTRAADLFNALQAKTPHLIVLDVSLEDFDAVEMVRTLEANQFAGGVIPVGSRDSFTRSKLQQVGRDHRLKMLPCIPKPLRLKNIEASLHRFEPPAPGAELAVDVGEAIHNGWMDLWYQPKIDLHSLSVCGAEALVRILHPSLGLLPPKCFLPESADPMMRLLSQFVIEKALSDWIAFMDERRAFEIAINVPMRLLEEPQFMRFFRNHVPIHPRFAGIIVEINETDVLCCSDRLVQLAAELREFKIRISVDNLASCPPSLANAEPFHFRKSRSADNSSRAAPRTSSHGLCAEPWLRWLSASGRGRPRWAWRREMIWLLSRTSVSMWPRGSFSAGRCLLKSWRS
jgi:CheY-like chemotaxis protein